MHTTIISIEDLATNLTQPNWVIVDCSYELSDKEAGVRQYQSGHIAGAVYAHTYHDLSGPPLTDRGRHPLPSAEKLRQLFSKLGISNDTQVVAYDRRGSVTAARLWWLLRYMGHTKAAVLDGGWAAWEAAGYPTNREEIVNVSAEFQGSPNPDMLVVIDEVLDQTCLIDSRDAKRFAGLAKGSDPVAGHIPGALNRHHPLNLDADKKMLSAELLRHQFSELLGNVPSNEATFYCGSGVSACINLLALAHAELPIGKLYVGSWSEWSRDEFRPKTTADE
ncbi:MAG: sulfurtransferase [Candidatus Promineifilaceae bacterium]